MKNIAVINGPNLNMLGRREKDIYGTASLEDIRKGLEGSFKGHCRLAFFQSNREGELVETIQAQYGRVDGIIINAGAYTHTSVAIRDALLAVGVPFVEVHLTNIFAREEFRHRSTLADKAAGVICGFGPAGYEMAVKGLLKILSA
jgi:3-dehydroquinate dehydratase-2